MEAYVWITAAASGSTCPRSRRRDGSPSGSTCHATCFAALLSGVSGRFATVAVHPCFAGPTASWTENGGVVVEPGYLATERRFVGSGVRRRVGVRHVPLGELLSKLASAGFRIDRVLESGPLPTPMWLGIAATLVR